MYQTNKTIYNLNINITMGKNIYIYYLNVNITMWQFYYDKLQNQTISESH